MRNSYAAILALMAGIAAAQTVPIGSATDGCTTISSSIWPAPLMRFGNFTCTVNAGMPGLYNVTLGFFEPSVTIVGGRLFSVAINGYPAIKNLDLVAEGASSPSTPVSKLIPNVLSVDGKIRVQITAGNRNGLLSSITVAPPQPISGGATQSADLIDCKVTAAGSTATVGIPCSLRMGTVIHRISQPATATLTGTAGTGTLYFFWSYQGTLVASQLTDATLACNVSCSVDRAGLIPQYAVPIGSVDFQNNVFGAITDLRAVFSTTVILCGGNLGCSGWASGAQVVDAGPGLVTKAQLQAGQATLCLDTGPVNAMACSPPSPYNGYTTGMVVQLVPANTNTGAVTLAISGLGPKPVKKADGTTDLSAGDLVAIRQFPLTFDGAVFRLAAGI